MMIRPAQPADIPYVLELWTQSRDELFPSDNTASLRALIDRDPEALLIAENEGRVLGSLIAGWDGWRGNIYRLAVHPDCRRQGVATRLVAAAEERLRQRGARRISVLVWHEDDRAVRMWQSAGYRCDDATRRFVKSV